MAEITTSAEELHRARLNPAPRPGEDVRLWVDLDRCAAGECRGCVIQCSYYYHPQAPGNTGIISVVELATYALVCRRCQESHCVKACPAEALQQQADRGGLLIRHAMRCVSCKSCSHACPYGTIYPSHVPLLIHNCDYCLDRRDSGDEPLCVRTCPHGALGLRRADIALDEHTFLVGDHLIVHSTHWRRETA